MKTISQIDIPRLVSSWANPNAIARLFCFPYAGGGPHIYRNWPQMLPHAVEFFAVQLPGQGARLRERPYTDIANAVEDLLGPLERYLDKPISLFGHSLGALICFELALRLRDKHGIEPGLLIVSGRGAPQIPSNAALTYNLPDRELINELQRLNGTPREVLDHPELMELMLPKIRADFQISETYNFVKKPPLNCPITVMGGADDQDVPRDSLEAWNEHTKGRFTLHMLPGDHFMIHSAEAAVVNLVNHDLRLMTGNSGNMPE